jgi:hypothetical protein
MTVAEAIASRRPAAPRNPLAGANVLILDSDASTALLLRDRLEQDHGARVDVAATLDEALDVLGNAARPVALVMCDTLVDGGACVDVLRLLIGHRAHVAVTLHGSYPPEDYAAPENLVGAAAYTHLANSGEAVAKAEEVLRLGLDVATIVARRIVPPSLDPMSGMAIYGAAPGDRFPVTLRV